MNDIADGVLTNVWTDATWECEHLRNRMCMGIIVAPVLKL